MRTLLSIFLLSAVLVSASAAAAMPRASGAPAGDAGRVGPPRAAFSIQPPGEPLTREEARALSGGDVRMVLDVDRDILTVQVIDNEYEARLGRIPPTEVYEVPTHNRVVTTLSAPFYPAPGTEGDMAGMGSLTSRPVPFPEGYWNITSVAERSGKYGPYMIGTNAVGMVSVFRPGVDGSSPWWIGAYPDTGYAIHSSTVDFDRSKSYGCIIVGQEDAERIAKTIADDRADAPDSRQQLLVKAFPEF